MTTPARSLAFLLGVVHAAGSAADNKIYLIGGASLTVIVNANEECNPASSVSLYVFRKE